ncbi:MAG TPA: ABC transporter ATP-binding protein [Candidatus Limnocylindrales bacterium]|nr:ABC transporter ATP-binding protein [Candidatus Limnocylindrales bacterium]
MSLNVDQGEVVTLVGANGAGKTTLLKTLSGLRRVSAGSVTFDGAEIVDMPGHKRVRLGISQAPEGRGIFPGMTVGENLSMGAYSRGKPDPDDLERVFTLFPRLAERRNQPGGTLSGGEQQMLAIGRALMARPRLLLLDEPSMGLAPQIIQLIFRIIREINEQGTTILLVEQNAVQALTVAHRAYVMETGHIVKTGTGKELLGDASIIEAYLGG